MELKTEAFGAVFDLEQANFTHLVNHATGDDYVKARPKGPLVELYAVREGEKLRLLPQALRELPDGQGVEIGRFGGLPCL